MTLSPTETSSGTRWPLSSIRPGPTERTSPSWGFSLAVSGMTRPEAVVCSASRALTTIRSSSGLMETDTCRLFHALEVVGKRSWVGTLTRRVPTTNLCPRLALGQPECQPSDPPWPGRAGWQDRRHGPGRFGEPAHARGLGPPGGAPPVRRGDRHPPGRAPAPAGPRPGHRGGGADPV